MEEKGEREREQGSRERSRRRSDAMMQSRRGLHGKLGQLGIEDSSKGEGHGDCRM